MGNLLFAAVGALGTVPKLMMFINSNLGTKYRNTDYYKWKSGKRRTPGTVTKLLREVVIRYKFTNKQAEIILDLIEPTELIK